MNERINELYQQAHREWHQEYYSSVVDPTIKSVSVTRHFDYELFAQLIVRECMSLADLPNNTTGQWDHLSPSEVIANYFGVKS